MTAAGPRPGRPGRLTPTEGGRMPRSAFVARFKEEVKNG